MKRVLAALVVAMSLAVPGTDARANGSEPSGEGAEFIGHLRTMIPKALDHTGVAGVAVGLVEDGEVVWLEGFGVSDRKAGTLVSPETTFNVGSISKIATAWGLMRLVEAGKIDLDAPANRYLTRWKIPGEHAELVTVRRLLSHTAGLGLPAVPEYGLAQPLPTLEEAIRDPVSGVSRVQKPGEVFRYSGGGYMVLQMLIEDVAGVAFETFMQREVLEPLGMDHSSFDWTEELLNTAATPYNDGVPVERFVYVGAAAASLNSSAGDLARLAAASFGHRETAVLRSESIRLMVSPAPDTLHEYGIQNGLGYSLWGGGESILVAGHGGQNTGYGAMLWTLPSSGDGIVALTNDSDGNDVWKWIHCDWIYWTLGIRWRGYCTDRPEWLPDVPRVRPQ